MERGEEEGSEPVASECMYEMFAGLGVEVHPVQIKGYHEAEKGTAGFPRKHATKCESYSQ